MSTSQDSLDRVWLREFLRVVHYRGVSIDNMVEQIMERFGRGVDIQPPVAPDQQPEPPVA
jgi:hypothetical protein